HIFRDTIRNGVAAAGEALKLMGFRSYQIEHYAHRFLEHDTKALRSLAAVRTNESEYHNMIRTAVSDLEQQMRSDLGPYRTPQGAGWDSESLVEEFGKSS
ncbi:MAG: hypothetical protein AAFU03_14955, partial [Bacteroidota bacterium]